MFKQVKLQNFRQHRDKTVNFADGVNVLRGLNEQGKSTILLALGYGLFGTKALSQPIDEVVTWGEPVKTLLVELLFTFNGMDYKVTRSKASAELTFGSEIVTGQTEVTKFIESLMNANADLANKLMFASQGSIRGALDQGPKAAMEIIEDLADFNLLDRIITAIQEHLPSGNTARVEERLTHIATNLGNEPEKPDVSALEHELAQVTCALAELKADPASVQAQIVKLEAEFKEGYDKIEVPYNKLVAQEVSLTQRITSLKADLESTKKNFKDDYDADKHQEAIKRVTEEGFAADKIRIYKTITALSVNTEDSWDGDQSSFLDFKNEQLRLKEKIHTEVTETRGEIRLQQAAIIKETACGLCGKDLTEIPEVAEKNAKAQKAIEEMNSKLAELEVQFKEVSSNLDACNKIEKAVQAVHPTLTRYEDHLALNKNTMPWGFAWKGETPKQPDGHWRKVLQECEALKEASSKTRGRIEGLEADLATAESTLERTSVAVKEQRPAWETFGKTVSIPLMEAKNKLREMLEGLKPLEVAKQQVELKLKEATVDYEAALKAYTQGKVQLDQVQAEIEQMNFNNALIKKIRAARPQITDRLWNIVLTSVSHYFSEVRGTRSTVTRDANGFKVDGQTIGGLSGSTLDALGLAIRLALTKTFLPVVDFLLLDEPGAACDSSRETNMLGMVAGAEVGQTILVTHSDLADAFANNLIQL